jgi:hypothetical protein
VFNTRLFELLNTRVKIGLMRTEAVKGMANGGAWIEMGGGYCTLEIGTWEVTNCRSLSADGVNSAFLIYGNAFQYIIDVKHLYVNSDCQFTTSVMRILNMAGDTSGRSRVRIHRVTNLTNQTAGDGLLMDWSTNNEQDILEIFDGFRLFEDVRASSTTVKRRVYYLFETYAPGGASYSTTKPWGLDGPTTDSPRTYLPCEIVVINPTGVGYPSRWYSPGGGINPTDWYPIAYHGGENGKVFVGDTSYTFLPYKTQTNLYHYTATASRDVVLSAGTAPANVKEGCRVYLKNSSGQSWVVKAQDAVGDSPTGGTSTLTTMANNSTAVAIYQDSIWRLWQYNVNS